MQIRKPRIAEFFAGAGMVRAALQNDWEFALANDIDPKKFASYRENWGDEGFFLGDVAQLNTQHLLQPIDLYWASSPCQDLSLAGNRGGLSAPRSGAFHSWMKHVHNVKDAGFAPRILAFENVSGLLSSNQGSDFAAVLFEFQKAGYAFGALEIDARFFLPQSRPRIFVIAVRKDVDQAELPLGSEGCSPFHTKKVRSAYARLPVDLKQDWIWWKTDAPAATNSDLRNFIDVHLVDPSLEVSVDNLIQLMNPVHRNKVNAAIAAGGLHVGTVYKRGRPDQDGMIRQRAEVRFDGVAGCIRTPAGGSSRQTVLIVEDGNIKARLLSAREAARLMGLSEDYKLPPSFNDAYKLSGDGVAVPVVKHLNETIFQPVLGTSKRKAAA